MSSIQTRINEIKVHIQRGNFYEAEVLLQDPIAFSGPTSSVMTQSIYLPDHVRRKLRLQIDESKEVNEVIKRNKTLALNQILPHKIVLEEDYSPRIPRDIVFLIANFEDFSNAEVEKRLEELFTFFLDSFCPNYIKQTLDLQIENRTSFPTQEELKWYVGTALTQNSTLFNYLDTNIQCFNSLKAFCTVLDRTLTEINKNEPKNRLSLSSVAKSVFPFLRPKIDFVETNSIINFESKMVFPSLFCKDDDIPLLRVVIKHFYSQPIKIAVDGKLFLTLQPAGVNGQFTMIAIHENLLPLPLLRTLLSCKVKVSSGQLNCALAEVFNKPTFNAELARSLINEGAELEKTIYDYAKELIVSITGQRVGELQSRVSFILSYPISKNLFSLILSCEEILHDSETMNLLLAYGRQHPKVLEESLLFFSKDDWEPSCWTIQKQSRSGIILIHKLIDLWIETSQEAPRKLTTMYFMSLTKKENPLTAVLEKYVMIKEVNDEMITVLLLWMRNIHVENCNIKSSIDLKSPVDPDLTMDITKDTTFILEAGPVDLKSTISILLENLNKKGLVFTKEEFLSRLTTQLLEGDTLRRFIESL